MYPSPPVYFLKMPCGNAGNGISKTVTLKIFWGNIPPDPPCLKRLQCFNVSSSEYTFKIPQSAPVLVFVPFTSLSKS